MEVTYTLSKDDVVGFQRFHTHRKGKLRLLVPALNIILGVIWAFQLWMVVRLVIQWRFLFALDPRVWSIVVGTHQNVFISFLIFSLYLFYVI